LLLDFGAVTSRHKDCDQLPLTLAVAAGHISVAELLIERDALLEERNEKGFTPLMEATNKGNSEMLTLLVRRGTLVQFTE